ncbi:MAG: 1-(5-phosphoribosyl)-5-[(5-phosphoribosylamino)methylideneamino]imidazole-4-carboxamide isomerase [Oscillospiraceae bacterium]|jgi:phosphoribosylformimino-5-aminoimidazole carboxamide ribotide isomerase|nr:1-(5-phosphoribosyl)-5-[(5-phosphoribosylamino)methylideneamino]imidazole-4-carboxamide isomerase [Oscillospiraceae bacterium]
MILLPAIDLFGGKVVRLTRGDYAQMTVYSDDPALTAAGFRKSGASWLHVVDLEGARDGGTPNIAVVEQLIRESGLRVEIGGGVRTREVAERYLDAGAARVILGTAAVYDDELLRGLLRDFGERIAVGVDVRDGYVAVRGWTELSAFTARDFCEKMRDIGVATIILTDISKDGLLSGANLELYREMQSLGVNIVASGGVTTIDDVAALRDIGLYGAILGRALYAGTLDLGAAVKLCEGEI